MSVPVGVGTGEDIQEILDKAQRLLDRIRNKMQKLVDKINGIPRSIPSFLVPDFIVDKIKTGIRKMNEVFTKLVSKIQEFFASPGWPPALFETGDRWLAQVAQPSATSEAEVSTGRLHVDDYWKGSAADAYKDTLGAQEPAFAAMAALARKIKEFLHTAAWGSSSSGLPSVSRLPGWRWRSSLRLWLAPRWWGPRGGACGGRRDRSRSGHDHVGCLGGVRRVPGHQTGCQQCA